MSNSSSDPPILRVFLFLLYCSQFLLWLKRNFKCLLVLLYSVRHNLLKLKQSHGAEARLTLNWLPYFAGNLCLSVDNYQFRLPFRCSTNTDGSSKKVFCQTLFVILFSSNTFVCEYLIQAWWVLSRLFLDGRKLAMLL